MEIKSNIPKQEELVILLAPMVVEKPVWKKIILETN
ncbi:MAG: hypothetical protein MRECE_19c001 [Mycoplasmataceae bacterium CE_OT135]|nr:MAG: hypothetical protein MRECE_19c001 [Mycoplasmataceae bacterium CE_OT135]